MGFDAMFFGRIDYQDKNKRMNDKTMEWVWMPSNELGTDVNIFAHTLYQGYGSPEGFGFDILDDNNDIPWINNQTSPDYNGPEMAKKLIEHLQVRQEHYLTDDLFVLIGEDFRFMEAENNYRSIDNMIDYMNENHNDEYFFKYSTPSIYIDALKEKEVVWPTKYDDLFPYADDPESYWTGYFTSRANDK